MPSLSFRASSKISRPILHAILGRFVQSLATQNCDSSANMHLLVLQCAIQGIFPGLYLVSPTTHSPTFEDCLTRNGYNEAKCAKFVDALYECCQAFYERNGNDAATVSCPKANLLRLKMEQRRKDIR
jgi:hypothetical protein